MERKSKGINSLKDHDYFIKVVLVGNSAVGKSSLMLRFADDKFTTNYVNTIGVDFRFKTFNVDRKRIKIQIWDTAGQEKFRTMTSAYYKGSDAVIMVYDVTEPKTFNEVVNYWIPEIMDHVEGITYAVLGNKTDLEDSKIVSRIEAENLKVGNQSVIFYEVSAKDSTNVNEAFEEIARKFMQKKQDKRYAKRHRNGQISDSIDNSQQDQTLDNNDDIYNLHTHLADGKSFNDDKSQCDC